MFSYKGTCHQLIEWLFLYVSTRWFKGCHHREIDNSVSLLSAKDYLISISYLLIWEPDFSFVTNSNFLESFMKCGGSIFMDFVGTPNPWIKILINYITHSIHFYNYRQMPEITTKQTFWKTNNPWKQWTMHSSPIL